MIKTEYPEEDISTFTRNFFQYDKKKDDYIKVRETVERQYDNGDYTMIQSIIIYPS